MALSTIVVARRSEEEITSGVAELQGIDAVDWIALQVIVYQGSVSNQTLNVNLEGSVNGDDWASVSSVGGVNSVEMPRGITPGQPFALHDLPPYLRVTWEVGGEISSISPLEFAILTYGGRGR